MSEFHIVGHTRPPRNNRSIKSDSAGRVCDAEDCSTVLSRYNLPSRGKNLCWVHRPLTLPRLRGTPPGSKNYFPIEEEVSDE